MLPGWLSSENYRGQTGCISLHPIELSKQLFIKKRFLQGFLHCSDQRVKNSSSGGNLDHSYYSFYSFEMCTFSVIADLLPLLKNRLFSKVQPTGTSSRSQSSTFRSYSKTSVVRCLASRKFIVSPRIQGQQLVSARLLGKGEGDSMGGLDEI